MPDIPATLPLVFAQITIGGNVYNAAETAMADAATYYHGYKAPTLLRLSPITRELSRDGYRTMRFSVELGDTGLLFRGLAASNTFDGAYVRVFIVDDAVRRAEGVPFQIASGYVVSFTALDGFRFALEVEDALGRVFSDMKRAQDIPSHKLLLADFWGLDPSYDGQVGPIMLGVLSNPGFGVAQGIFMGEININDLHPSGINLPVYVLLFSEGALADSTDFYYNSDVWQATTVIPLGYYVHPTAENSNGYVFVCTTAGTTGSSEPTWPTTGTVADGSVVWTTHAEDQAGNLRFEVPDGAFSATGPCFSPHKPNWTAATGLTTNYVDWQGRRYGGLLLLDKTHPYAAAVKEGRITVTMDAQGHAVNANGTGGVIKKPGAVIKHVVKNCILSESTWLAYNTSPTFSDGTAILDEASFNSADTRTDGFVSGGYVCGLVLGRGGSPQQAWTVIRELQEGTGYELGVNRLGQLMADVADPNAAAVIGYDATSDLVSLEVRPNTEDYTNRVDARYGYRYRDPVPLRTPAPHSPAAPQFQTVENDWDSDTVVLQIGAAQTAVGRTAIYELDNYVVRESLTAEDVATRYLNRFVGPPNALDGARQFELVTGLQGLGKGSTIVELGTVITITHPEGLSGAGWTNLRARVTAITVDPMACRVTLKGYVLDDVVLAVFPPAGSLTFSGSAPSLQSTLAPPAGTLTLTGGTPTLV